MQNTYETSVKNEKQKLKRRKRKKAKKAKKKQAPTIPSSILYDQAQESSTTQSRIDDMYGYENSLQIQPVENPLRANQYYIQQPGENLAHASEPHQNEGSSHKLSYSQILNRKRTFSLPNILFVNKQDPRDELVLINAKMDSNNKILTEINTNIAKLNQSVNTGIQKLSSSLNQQQPVSTSITQQSASTSITQQPEHIKLLTKNNSQNCWSIVFGIISIILSIINIILMWCQLQKM